MNLKIVFLNLAFVLFLIAPLSFAKTSGGAVEYTGKFDAALVANTEDFEKVVFKYAAPNERSEALKIGEKAHTAAARLYNPQTNSPSLSAMLVEEADKNPLILIDANGDGAVGENEKFAFEAEDKDNPYLWKTTVNLPVQNNLFTVCPIFLRYFRTVQIGKMSADDRLLTQSTEVFARGKVDVGDRKVAVQFTYNFADKIVDAQKGWLGIDANGDGAIDMDKFSPEAAKAASGETVVFRAGQIFLSADKADIKNNLIVLRGREAKDYKRVELSVGRELPDFEFVDLNGKKRRFSEFRGKYVILDFWGLWCPACRTEIPYLREAYKRFKDRNLEIVGMNTDEFPPEQIRQALEKGEINWTQAQLKSIFDLINVNFRIESFPSTFLVAPDGKLVSMSRTDRDEPNLRGKDLLDTLDKILPKK